MAKNTSKVKQMNSWRPNNLQTILIVVVIIAICLFVKRFEDPYSDCLTDVPTAAAKAMEQFNNYEHIDFLYHNETTNSDTDTDALLQDILDEMLVPNENPNQGDYAAMEMLMPDKTGFLDTPKKDGTSIFYFTVKAKHKTSKSNEESFERSAAAIKEAMKLDGASDAEKAKAIYAYVCEHAAYAAEQPEDDKDGVYVTAYGADKNGKASSTGFAQYLYYLLTAEGVHCRIVVGDNHTYNLVWIDDNCYIADAAWDAGKAEGQWECFLTGSDDYKASFPKAEVVNVIEALRHTADGVNISKTSYK
ncbi:MAG: transglutaminase-like domain-containing protein [Dorea sp.]|nr:transglutaminase-like domain-containing protein [Dorea sp.]